MKAVPPCLPKSACPEPGAGMLCEAKAASHGERRWQAVVVQPVCEMVQSLKQVAVSPVRLATGRRATRSMLPEDVARFLPLWNRTRHESA